MSRLPSEAASRNMSACSAQAISQVGCRLMVASSANTSRPLAPGACGDIARALATKAAMSSEADDFVSGSEPVLPDAAFCAGETSPRDFGLVGSPGISARRQNCRKLYVGGDWRTVEALVSGERGRWSVPRRGNRSIWRNRAGIGHHGRGCLDRLERAVIIEEFVEHALDRCLRLVRTGIA